MTTQNPKIISIVEGDGDVNAVPILLRRILWELGRYDVDVQKPIRSRGGKSGLIIEFERLIQIALTKGCDAILIMVETDTDDCPMELAIQLTGEATRRNLTVPVAIVCPNSEYETWFIASLSEDSGYEIRRRLGIDDSVTSPTNVESVRGAKEWLSNRMPDDGYSPAQHQADLTPHIDLDLVRSRSRSFRRLCHAVEELLDALDGGLSAVTPAPDDGGSGA